VTPIAHFDAVWLRCGHLSAMQAYLAANVAGALRPDELLRAEWVARVSALDLYLHRLIADRMRLIFEGKLPKTPAFDRFLLPTETVERIRSAKAPADASSAFDLEVRRQLGFLTFQDPDRIADGVRLCSSVELWNAVAVHQGATAATKALRAKSLKQSLSAIVDRRNKIAHEGDLQPTLPIEAWPIARSDLSIVENFVARLVASIDACA
jgi:hypothetical protein